MQRAKPWMAFKDQTTGQISILGQKLSKARLDRLKSGHIQSKDFQRDRLCGCVILTRFSDPRRF
jgi:hypothetical protein